MNGTKRKIYMYSPTGILVKEFDSITDAASYIGATSEAVIRMAAKYNHKSHGHYWKHELTQDPEIIKENVRLAKQRQKEQDLNRIKNKSFREHARVENALEALTTELIDMLKEVGLKIETIEHRETNDDTIFLVQVSDPHFNELVDLPANKYDFLIASKRLQKYAEEIIKEAQLRNVSRIVVAFTGDMLNSNRRLDELLNMSTNRATAAILAAQLLSYFIKDLNNYCNVSLTYITGNESRIDPDFGFSPMLTSDNFDSLIFNMLVMIFKNHPGIDFIYGDTKEKVVNIKGKNILITHGEEIKDSQKGVQQKIGKYSGSGIDIYYVVFGHIHFANITDLYSRSGSLVGMNAYSDRGLDLVTRASQVFHVITSTSLHSMRVDLQDTTGYKGYPIQYDLDAYNAKSLDKLHKKEIVIQVVI